ncbi:MAG: GGDEF domain-containing protein, partial [Jaaginema sp. PMC 1079.18]|nr:GGDEF domain-containing protein [Jaaginema sp. PMC 1079.18]
IDYFKKINDTYGHNVGDEALIEFARVVQNNLRKPDQLGRFGGEEFVVFLPETDREAALEVAERLRCAIAAIEIPHPQTIIRFTVSIGAATYCERDGNFRALLLRSDKALYTAKTQGRNRVVEA